MPLNAPSPVFLASTALMILRNRLGVRVWGSCGVNSLPIDDSRYHPGTIGQCFIANAFLQAINASFDARITPLSDGEILKVAVSVSRASRFILIGTGTLALFGYGCRRARAA